MNLELAAWLMIVLLLRVTTVATLQALSASRRGDRYRVYDIPVGSGQKTRERYAPLAGAALDTVALALLIHFELIHFVGSSLMEFLIFLSVHVLVVEPLYYGYHRMLHTRYVFKRHHYLHHLSTVTQPSTSFTFTFTERASYTALFAIPILVASYLDALSLGGLTVYILTFDLLNSIGHLNCEFFRANKTIRRFFYTPSFHARHHSKFNCNYSLFMPIFDHIFKTVDPQEEALHLQVRAGQALKRLAEHPGQGTPLYAATDSRCDTPR
ncbi:MAG: hypothetical protein RLZZ169_1269 [Pseudomonadota bacterium]